MSATVPGPWWPATGTPPMAVIFAEDTSPPAPAVAVEQGMPVTVGLQARDRQVLEHRQHALVDAAAADVLTGAGRQRDRVVGEHLGLELLL